MAETLGSAVLELSTDNTKLESGLKTAETSANTGLSNLKKVALGVGAVGVTAAAGFGAQMLKSGAEVEAAFAEVRTLLPTIGDEAFGALQKDVLDLGKEMNVATSDSIPALYQAISAGVPAENVVDFLKIASEAAVGGVTDLETAVDGITSVVNAYGTETISAQEASDLMFTAVKLGKTDFEQLSNKISNITPIASSLGVGFDEIAAAMALMTAQGVPTAESTTQLRQLLVEASKGGTDLSDAIADVTGKSLPDLVKEGKPVSEILDEVRSSMPEQEFRDLFGSVEAMNAAMLITGPNAEAMAGNLDEMRNSAGASEAAFETMAATTQFKVTRGINWAKTTMADWGNRILPVLVSFVEDKLIPAFNSISDWFTDNKETLTGLWAAVQEAAQAFVTWVTDNIVPIVVAAFNAISTWVTDNKEGITGFFDAMKTAASTLVDYFSTSFGLISTVLQTLFDLIAPQAVDTGGIGKFFTNLVTWATTAVDWYSEFLSGITDAIQGIIDWINENPDKIQAWFETARAAVEVAVNAIATIVGGVIKAVQAIVTWVQENPDTIQKWFDTAKAALETTIDAISTVIGGVVTAVQKIVTWVNENPDTIQGWFETAKTALETVIGAIETTIGWVVAAIQSITAWVQENPETISGWFETAKAALETVVGVIETVIGGVVTAVQAIATWVKENPDTIQAWFDSAKTAVETTVGVITTTIDGIVTAVKVIKTWIDNNQEAITGFFGALKTAAQGVYDFFNTSWELVTTVLGQLWNIGEDEEGEPAVQRLFNNIVEWGKGVVEWFGSEEGGAAISAFFTNIVAWATTAVEWFAANVGGITDSIAGITTFLSENPTAIQDWFNNAWETVSTVKDNMLTAVDNIVEKWNAIGPYFETLWGSVKGKFVDGWNSIVEAVLNPFYAAGNSLTLGWAEVEQWFLNMWNNVGGVFTDTWQAITDLLFPDPSYAQQIKEVWGGIVTAIASVFTSGANAAIDVLNDLVALFNTALKKWNDLSFSISGFSASVPWPSLKNPLRKKEVGWGGVSIETPNIALLPNLAKFPLVPVNMAEGGIVPPSLGGTLARLGEAGQAEAVIPLDSPQAARLGVGGGSGTVIYAENIYGWDNLRDLLAEAGVDIQRGGARNSFAGI